VADHFLLLFTLGALVKQVAEMMKVYDPIKDQADAAAESAKAAARQANDAERATIQAARAWVGPSDAAPDGDVKPADAPLSAIVRYQNSGREPATRFISATPDRFAVSDEDDRIGNAWKHIEGDVANCMTTLPPPNGQVVYPSSFSAYSVVITFPKEMLEQDALTGNKMLIIQGCFVYVTTGMVHHSTWCYYYRAGTTKRDHLSICTAGNYAD
jgi:hypothetical protein